MALTQRVLTWLCQEERERSAWETDYSAVPRLEKGERETERDKQIDIGKKKGI